MKFKIGFILTLLILFLVGCTYEYSPSHEGYENYYTESNLYESNNLE